MNANAFRHFYNYHFAENRKIWNHVASLPREQFNQVADYSRGSIRDQIVHLIEVEEVWFSELRGVEPLDSISPSNYEMREDIRVHWDKVEQRMQAYLAELQDDMLLSKPIKEPEEDKNLCAWQVLLQVANHATDHRAQILRQLYDLGVKTESQDYIFYAYENP